MSDDLDQAVRDFAASARIALGGEGVACPACPARLRNIDPNNPRRLECGTHAYFLKYIPGARLKEIVPRG